MKVLKYPAPKKAEIIEVETPRPSGNEVLTKSLYCSVSAGTEMGFYRGTAPQIHAAGGQYGLFSEKKDNIRYPMQSNDPGVWWMGYANVSRVVELGPDVKSLKTGDVVFTGAGHQEYQCRPEGNFTKLGAETNLEHAALLSLVQIAFNGILDAGIRLMDSVAIFGLGTLGQLMIQMAKKDGALVIAVDGCDNRLSLARQAGADHVLDFRAKSDIGTAVHELTDGRGADTVIEVSGNVNALPNAVRSAAYNAKVTVLSFYQAAAASLELGKEFHHKRIILQSSQIGGLIPEISNSWNGGRRMSASLRLLKELKIDPIISHRVAFSDLPHMLEVIDKDPSACNAVIVKY